MDSKDNLEKLISLIAPELGLSARSACSRIKTLAQLVDEWQAAEVTDACKRQFGDALLGLAPIDTRR
jgi:hypothetical protein